MADTDLFGILSLLLAIGGAVYLLRARIFSRGEVAPTEETAEEGRTRNAITIPPKLRPRSDPPVAPAAKRKSDPKAKASKPSSSKSAAAKPASERAESAKPSEPKPSEPKPSEVKPSEPKRVEPKTVAASKAAAPEAAPVSTPRPSEPTPSTPKPGPPRPSPERRKSGPTSVPQSTGSVEAAKAAAPTSSPTRRVERESEPALPRIEVEEDEDVEPTKVGKTLAKREIQPPVVKILFDPEADKATGPSSKPLLVVYALAQTDPGKRRKQNEDSFLVLEDQDLFVVADGMGGHRGGQHASRLAVKTMADAFQAKKFEAAAHPELPVAASELARAIQMANAAILDEATRTPALKGMGTTLCAARFANDRRRLYLGHVGDSRCYRVRAGSMKQMTADHTMADYGVTGPEGAHLSRALGVWPTVPIDVVLATPELGDLYLLCSDGLTKMLTNETIATQLLHENDPKAAVERLVFFANAHGGKDNITIVLLRVVEPGWKPPSAA